MKEILTILAIIIGIISYIPYFVGIFKKTVKPHPFTWFIWATLTGIAFFAQLSDGGGVGSWVTGFTALVSFSFVLLSIKYGFKGITKSDWFTFIAGIISIPVWILTNNPLWSVVIITVIDALAFFPTFRKTWKEPSTEPAITYLLSSLKFFIALFALETITLTTFLYPFSLVLMNTAFVFMLVYRRKR